MPRPAITLTYAGGPAGAPWLILGPSLGTTGNGLWNATLPVLAKRYRVATWDLPGHGASPRADDAFTVGELADAVHDCAQPHGAVGFHYAGVSLGGAVGIELGLRHPSDVQSLVVIASGARLSTPTAWRDRAAAVRAISTRAVVAGSARRWFAPAGTGAPSGVRERLLRSLEDVDDESYARCCDALAQFDVRDRLRELKPPVLVLWGEFDAVAPETAAIEVATGVPDGTVALIADAAHLPPAEQPAATAAWIDTYIQLTAQRSRRRAACPR
jgi:3-oxoadipate enol-lactonase